MQQRLRRSMALRSRCARRSLDLRSSLLTLDRGQASLALFSLKRSLSAASRQHGFTLKFKKNGGGRNHAVPAAAADAVGSVAHGLNGPASECRAGCSSAGVCQGKI